MDRIEFISEYRPSHTYIFWDSPSLMRPGSSPPT